MEKKLQESQGGQLGDVVIFPLCNGETRSMAVGMGAGGGMGRRDAEGVEVGGAETAAE